MQNKFQIVSIIMPSYNHGHFLKRSINSVISQSFSNWELIIIDNHSNDDTDQIISSFKEPRIRVYKIHNDGVVAKSRNFGIKVARGIYIAFLDSDDWWTSLKLEISIRYLNNGNDFVYHDLFLVKNLANINSKKLSFRRLKAPIFDSLLTSGNAIINSSVVLKSELLQNAGILDENVQMVASEDFDLWIRVSLLTNKFKKIPSTLGFYWYGGANLSKNKDLSIAGDIILKKYSRFLLPKKNKQAYGYLNYTKAFYLYLNRDFRGARSAFFKSLVHGNLIIKLKSSFRIFSLIISFKLFLEK